MNLFRATSMLSAFVLSACAATTPETIGPRVDSAPTVSLWQAHRDPSLTPLQLSFVEAELASRGATSSGTSYIGQKQQALTVNLCILAAVRHQQYTMIGIAQTLRHRGKLNAFFSTAVDH